jgi:hypothetical protein
MLSWASVLHNKNNNTLHLHYFDEGNAFVNWVAYYFVNVSIGYCTNEINEIK